MPYTSFLGMPGGIPSLRDGNGNEEVGAAHPSHRGGRPYPLMYRAPGGRGGGRGRLGSMSMREAMMGLAHSGLPPSMLFSDRDFTADDYELLCKLDEGVENRKGATQQEM